VDILGNCLRGANLIMQFGIAYNKSGTDVIFCILIYTNLIMHETSF